MSVREVALGAAALLLCGEQAVVWKHRTEGMPLGRAMDILKSKRVEAKDDKMKMPTIERVEVD